MLGLWTQIQFLNHIANAKCSRSNLSDYSVQYVVVHTRVFWPFSSLKLIQQLNLCTQAHYLTSSDIWLALKLQFCVLLDENYGISFVQTKFLGEERQLETLAATCGKGTAVKLHDPPGAIVHHECYMSRDSLKSPVSLNHQKYIRKPGC